jgi:hypothetical protein
MHFAADWYGSDSVTIVVMDRAGLRDSTRVAVHVRPVNDSPVLARVPDLTVPGDSTIVFSLAGYVMDVDDTTLCLRAEVAPMGPADSEASIEHVEGPGRTGPASSVHFAVDSLMNVSISFAGRFQCESLPVVVKVHDPQGGFDLDTLFLTVAPVVLPPVTQEIRDTLAAPDVPADYVLFQNYPNPFNPSTTFRFGLPEPSRVSAEVFNILGQRVATVFASDLQEGYHTMQWSPLNLASGAYIIVLEAHGLVSAGRESRMIKKISLVH